MCSGREVRECEHLERATIAIIGGGGAVLAVGAATGVCGAVETVVEGP